MNKNKRSTGFGSTRRAFLAMGARTVPLLFLSPTLRAFTPPHPMVHRTAYAMGTTVSIRAYGEDRATLHRAITRSFSLLDRYDRLFSTYRPESDISRINRSSGISTVAVAPEVTELLALSKEYHALTGSRFDCTVEPLKRMWGFYDRRESMPTDREISRTLESIGDRFLTVDKATGHAGLLRTGAAVDLGGIAVGYTVDAMVSVLKDEGITSALIDHSGDIYAIGAPPEDDAWTIGIPHPFDQREVLTTVRLKDRSISTSGNYNSIVEYDGHRYGHIMDPGTGRPSSHVLSISVIADSSLDSDVLSTALFSDPGVNFKSDKFGTKLETLSINKDLTLSYLNSR